MRILKIHSTHSGWKWIASGIIIGVVVPLVLWAITHRIYWLPVIVGGILLLVFPVILMIEMHQGLGKKPYDLKAQKEQIPFDPEKQEVVIRCSVCSGEKVAGFKDKQGGHFTEVMVIRSPEDEQKLKAMYHLKTIRREY